MNRVVTFGEALFRFTTEKGERLRTASKLDFHLGGTELNISSNLASFGISSDWVSVVPDGPMGEMIFDRVQSSAVGLRWVQTRAGRAGWYMMESGAQPRPDRVVSRNASVFAECSFEFDWKTILTNACVFHTSGVTAGLGESCTQEIERAMIVARSQKVQVSYDFNYRANLWPIEEAVRRQKPLLKHVDVLFCGFKELELFFGWTPQDKDFKKVFEGNSIKTIVLSVRNDEKSTYQVEIITPAEYIRSNAFQFENVDRIGVGDSMTAGFWTCKLSGGSPADTANFAAAAGALKYSIKGDAALLKRDEVESLVRDGYQGVIR